MATIDDIRRDANGLLANLSVRDNKYRRNFNRVTNNGRRSEDIRNPYGNPLSYYQFGDENTGVMPVINIVKSAIDTYISKLSQTKVRPFFNAVNGTFKTRKICRVAQVYFDEFYNEQKIYHKAVDAAKDAAIFECGHLWARDNTKDVIRLKPWEYFYDRAEYQNGKLSRCLIQIKQYPLIYFADAIKKFPDLQADLNKNMSAKVTYEVYYHLTEKKRYTFLNGICIKTDDISYDIAPVATIYHNPPVKGGFSTSMVDDVYTLQTEIDMLSHRIHTAAVLNPANTIFIPDGQDIKASMISNEIGNVYSYKNLGASPITISTPAAISPQYIELLKFYEEKAYNILGISMLSAQSKKPGGINSGVALDTLEDVESERHNTMLQNYIAFLMDVAKVCIEVFPENENILPNKIGTAAITWGQIKKEAKNYSMQFGASSALSKDPKVKMEQIEKMKSMGFIKDEAVMASLMDIPDLERAYSVETASLDVCERIIERAIEQDVYDFYESVNLEQLYNLIVYYINRLDANDESVDIIQHLVKLLGIVKGKIDDVELTNNPPPPPMPEVPVDPMAAPVDPMIQTPIV